MTDSDFELDLDPEEEAELKALRDKIIKEQTVLDRKVADKFYRIFEKAGTPTTWKTVVRYPRINGKNYIERDRENPPQVNLWKPGHEIKKRKDYFFWACMYVETYPQSDMYVHHSLEVHRDGRLIGCTHSTLGERIDVKELNKVLDIWSTELKDKNVYRDKVEWLRHKFTGVQSNWKEFNLLTI